GTEIERLAEIALERSPQPAEVLDSQRPVEAVGLAHHLDVGLARPLASDGERWIARQSQQYEGDRRDEQRHHDGEAEALAGVAEQRSDVAGGRPGRTRRV